MKKIMVALIMCVLLSGCTTLGNTFKAALGTSTKEIEESRAEASVKVFEYDYKTCYEKMEKLLNRMPLVSIYAKNDEMIAVFYINPDTTPVGIFFKSVDATHTQIEISSPSTVAKEWIAKNVFSETIVERKKADMKLKGD